MAGDKYGTINRYILILTSVHSQRQTQSSYIKLGQQQQSEVCPAARSPATAMSLLMFARTFCLVLALLIINKSIGVRPSYKDSARTTTLTPKASTAMTNPSVGSSNRQKPLQYPVPSPLYNRLMLSGPFPFGVTRVQKRNFKLLFLIGLLSIEFLEEVYVRLPQNIVYGSFPSVIVDRKKEDDKVVIVFPGAGGVDENTQQLEEAIRKSDRAKGLKRYVRTYDWLQYRGSFVRASFDAQMVGNTICSDLVKKGRDAGRPITSLHVIGISVGAFAADSCTKAYALQSDGQQPGARLTLLDPFTSKGIFGYEWGVKNMGKYASVTESYLNTDDPVPTTNNPLELAYTIDVTNSEQKKLYQPKNGDSMHSWPVKYLASNWRTEVDKEGRVVMPVDEEKGKVVQILH